jgi:NAD-dependent dihydropyrimidine dehydrogenase PreA subunit
MTDVYQDLAKKLDEMPNGFPATKSGVELKILQKIFVPHEAEMAMKIRPAPETASSIAERLDKPLTEMKAILDNMASKGQIACFNMSGHRMYMFVPFVIGIYELQQNRIDKELAELFEEYEPTLTNTIGGYKPAYTRVVPINSKISADLQINRYEDLRHLIDAAKSFRLSECICRKEKALGGHPCGHTLEACLSFSKEENAYDSLPLQRGKIISKDEALKVLADAEEEGLVHCTYNVQDGQTFVCNCCPCSCALMRGLKEFKAPHLLAKSNFVAVIDEDSCETCGICKNERCPMDAIIEENAVYSVQPERCIGCGVCAVTCPTDSITLTSREAPEQEIPSANMLEWQSERAAMRGIKIKVS